MRARHRHFNPTGAGAAAVFDARYISGLSDGDGVATWKSLSGSNDISQATAGNRPAYKVNRINGSPSVLWDGGANDELTFSAALTYSNFSILIVFKNADATNGSVVFARNNNFASYAYFTTNTFVVERERSGAAAQSSTRTHNLGNVFLIASSVNTSDGDLIAYTNSLAGTTASSALASSITTTGIGKYQSTTVNTDGDLGLAVLANVSWSSPLRRRCEHAAAYSFKIACN